GRLVVWLWRRAYRVKPSADINLGVAFTAVMSASRRARGFGIPSTHSEFGISALNHKPVVGMVIYNSANFTSEFLHLCHKFLSRSRECSISNRTMPPAPGARSSRRDTAC